LRSGHFTNGPFKFNCVERLWGFRDRCYDFLNIFAKKISKKLAFLTRNKSKFFQNFDRNVTLVFEKNANFLPKIAENLDHNSTPRSRFKK
jgi:hypothetical protein